jgi:hypothetical protein
MVVDGKKREDVERRSGGVRRSQPAAERAGSCSRDRACPAMTESLSALDSVACIESTSARGYEVLNSWEELVKV